MEEDVKWNVHFNKTGKLNRRICTSTDEQKWLCWAHLLRLLAVLLIKSFYTINTATDRHMKFTYLIQIPAYKHLYADSPALIMSTKQENWTCQAWSQFSPWFKVPSIHLFILLFVHSWWGQNILWIFFSRNQFLPLLTSGSKSQRLRQILITEDWKYFCITVSQEVGQI